MATVAALVERVRLIGLSLANAHRKGDDTATAKWAHQLSEAAAALANAMIPAAPPVVVTPPAPPVTDLPGHVLTYDEETAIFLDAEDAILKDLGRPYGRDGAERGALPLTRHIEMCKELGLPLHQAEFEAMLNPDAKQ